MERLLADAEKISGQKFNIDSYADVVKAINVIQTDMGITGTTAQEAAHTISGSINSMKAAWTNFLTGLMNGQADISGLFKQLAQSIVNVAQNVIPAIGNLGFSIVELIGGEDAANQAREMVNGIIAGFQDFAARMAPIGKQLMGMVKGILPIVQPVANGIMKAVSGIASILSQVLPPILSVVVPIVQTIASVVGAAVSVIWTAIGGIVDWLAQNVAPYIAEFFNFISPFVQDFANMVTTNMQQIQPIVEVVMNAIGTVISFVWNNARTAVTNAVNAIKAVINGLKAAVGVVKSIFNAIKNAIVQPIETAKNIISGVINTIKGLFSFSVPTPHIPVPHFTVSPPGWKISDLLKGTIPDLGIKWYAQGGFTNGATILNGAGERGTEFVWPSYSPYFQKYANALAAAMPNGTNVYINGTKINDDPAIEGAFWNFMGELQRRYDLNGAHA